MDFSNQGTRHNNQAKQNKQTKNRENPYKTATAKGDEYRLLKVTAQNLSFIYACPSNPSEGEGIQANSLARHSKLLKSKRENMFAYGCRSTVSSCPVMSPCVV